jgi:hypothetical protein
LQEAGPTGIFRLPARAGIQGGSPGRVWPSCCAHRSGLAWKGPGTA